MSQSRSNSSHPAGSKYSGASLATIEFDISISRQISAWIKSEKNFLVFLGSPGVGKTYLCAAVYNYYRDFFPRKNIRFWNERELFTRIRASMDQKGDYLDYMRYLCDDDFLIIDDVGSSGINDWRRDVLFDLIDFRYSSGKPTVFTSNLSKEDIVSQLGERSFSRLFDKENTHLNIVGKDRRLEG